MANRIARRSGFLQRGGRSVRESLWLFGAPVNVALGAPGTASLMASLNAAALALRPFTVVRVRGEVLVKSDQSAATETFVGSFGMAVVSDQAIAIGVTAVPTPGTDRGSDLFFVYETQIGTFHLIGTSAISSFVSRSFDSKAMRKVNEGQDIAVVAEADTFGSGVTVTMAFRMLIKLH